MNPCPYTVSPSARISQVFNLFRTMGLRHLPVVNAVGEVSDLGFHASSTSVRKPQVQSCCVMLCLTKLLSFFLDCGNNHTTQFNPRVPGGQTATALHHHLTQLPALKHPPVHPGPEPSSIPDSVLTHTHMHIHSQYSRGRRYPGNETFQLSFTAVFLVFFSPAFSALTHTQ